jgi:hypothetical protein
MMQGDDRLRDDPCLARRGQTMSLFLGPSFSSDDVDILHDALDSWCHEKRIDIASSDTQFAASAAIDLFQSGYNTSEKLLTALREHRLS